MKLRHWILQPIYGLYGDRLARKLAPDRLPRHIGVILDGHRRFARSEGLTDYTDGYRVGMSKLLEFLGWTAQTETPAVTLWVLSKENLARPSVELEPYFEVLGELFTEELGDRARELDMSVNVIGSIDLLPVPLAAAAKGLEGANPNGSRRLTIALAYGGRQEIVDAVRDLVSELVVEGVPPAEMPERVDADAIAANLYTTDLPDPDLVIRTSGESRLSGFLLWQSAYAEYSFIDVFWPAFRRVDYLRALRDFTRRERRFGR
ncbi:MAG: polyprenyl diphosphate synthase [Acidimicrobiia bacterium]